MMQFMFKDNIIFLLTDQARLISILLNGYIYNVTEMTKSGNHSKKTIRRANDIDEHLTFHAHNVQRLANSFRRKIKWIMNC